MHAFHFRRIDENLHQRPRRGQLIQFLRIQLDGDIGFGIAVLVRLEEIRAQGAVEDVAQAADDAVVVEDRHVVQRCIDARMDRFGGLFAALLFGIVADGEEFDQEIGDVRIPEQRRLDIVLAEIESGLAQIFRRRAQDRHVAPRQACRDDELVQPVAFGRTGHDRLERIFQRRLLARQIGGAVVGAFHQEIEHRRVAAPAVACFQRDRIGIFGDHAEAKVFEHRQRRRQRQHGAEHIELQPHRIVRVARQPIGARLDGGIEVCASQGFQLRQIDDCDFRRERIAIARGEAGGVALEHAMAVRLAVPGHQGCREAVVPGADRVADLRFQRMRIDMRPGAFIAPDDEMHARQRRIVQRRRRGRHPPVERLGENGVDALARARVVTVARHEDERGDEPVEPVEAQEHAHLGPLAQLQDAQRRREQFVFAHLEKFVARIGVENMRQRLAVMAVRREARALQHMLYLRAQQRDFIRSAAVGAGGEESDEAMLAGEFAVLEHLHADIIHVDAAMHDAALVRFGDDERHRLGEEGADFRRQNVAAFAALHHARAGVRQNAKAAMRDRVEMAAVGFAVGIVARAQEGEMIVAQPFEESDAFLQFGGRDVGCLRAQRREGLCQMRLHLLPVAHGEAHLREHRLHVFDQRGGALAFHHAFQHHHDHAFGNRIGLAAARAVRIARDLHDGMEQRMHPHPLRAQRGGQRVEQKRHVVIDGDQHALVARAAGVLCVEREDIGQRLARLAFRGVFENERGQRGQRFRRIARDVLRRRAREQRVVELQQGGVVAFQQFASGGDAVLGVDLVGLRRARSVGGIGADVFQGFRAHDLP